MIHETRIRHLNESPLADGDYVLYWMQQSQREDCNHALEYSVRQANQQNLPVLVCFGLTDDYPDANLRHYYFMLEGLAETKASLEKRGVKMVVRKGAPDRIALDLGKKASMIVCDFGPLRHQRVWRKNVAKNSLCKVVQIESDTIVPLEEASNKAEYAARTIRPKISRLLDFYLQKIKKTKPKISSLNLNPEGESLDDIQALLDSLSLDQSVSPVSRFFKGGTSRAKRKFNSFVNKGLADYSKNGNQPQTNDISHMSPYLHFGQISPLYLALKIQKEGGNLMEPAQAYLEQLIIRRELAFNFVYFTENYDSYSCLPNWAQTTLAEHSPDERNPVYLLEELDGAQTHDPYWNAAMDEMKATGFMHNYMRMYWGKKILEWSPTPELAYESVLGLNNKYFLDGRDPNSYAGVAWIFGLHDRAWKERSIFGKIRYMSASGLERKCDIKAYVEKVGKYKSQTPSKNRHTVSMARTN